MARFRRRGRAGKRKFSRGRRSFSRRRKSSKPKNPFRKRVGTRL